MVITEKLVFVELHKTGCTHIGWWLKHLCSGRQEGKHNRVPRELWNRFILGSVRSPWDWYVSLWAFGCQGKGSVRRQTTRGVDSQYVWRQLNKEMGFRRLPVSTMTRQCWNDLFKPKREWERVYEDARNPRLFRAWLRMLFEEGRQLDVGEGFGFSPLAESHGLLTYRFLKLFTATGPQLYRDPYLRTPRGAEAIWNKHRLVDFVIRTENLEEDLLSGLAHAGHSVSEKDAAALRRGRLRKTNASTREPASFYYDKASIDLVAQRDWLIVREFNYRPPK